MPPVMSLGCPCGHLAREFSENSEFSEFSDGNLARRRRGRGEEFFLGSGAVAWR